MRHDLPTGTVTFMFTDVEGSTQLLHELGEDRYAQALAGHRQVLRETFAAWGGVEVDTQGDAFLVAFPTAPGAVQAALTAQAALEAGPIRVRIGLHTGTPVLTEEGYVGEAVHLGARIAAAGHGGQVLLSMQTRELVEDDVLDLGEHRLKDFERPWAIFQLGSERFAPLKTISNTNLPRPLSSFVGRAREVAEVAALLRDGTRLVTLTGPGGTGKTRLAIEAASRVLGGFKAGVFWVGLAPIRDPALVADAIAQTLGAKDELASHIGARELLLVLDNLEQVIEAATELASLLESCPRLSLLVTSRELLRVRGESEYAVRPLAERDAVELFCIRAQTGPEPSIGRLCEALDHLPLAVELAAARAGVLSPRQILDRLSERLDLLKGGRDLDPRQRTLRATIEWSYDLLSPPEQTLFARLAVFAGGCTFESAEQIAGAEVETLQSLVDQSLVKRIEDRFLMLETIREYASERLQSSTDAAEVTRRHAEHFVSLAEAAQPHVREETLRGGSEWIERLEREHENLRSALDQLEGAGETVSELRLAAALSRFWRVRAHIGEGRRRLERALGDDQHRTQARARALTGASDLAALEGDISSARRFAHEALQIHRELGDESGAAEAAQMLGYAFTEEGDLPNARANLQAAVAGFRLVGDEDAAVWTTRTLAWTYHEDGDLARARLLHEDSVRRARMLGNSLLTATLLGALAMIATDEGRIEESIALLAQALPIWRELAGRAEMTVALCRVARVLAVTDGSSAATQLLACAEAQFEEMGGSEPWVARMNSETLAVIGSGAESPALTLEEGFALALRGLEERASSSPSGT